ncbi:MAG: hypothetical protein L6R42_001050 [Xanthoria sp. 1 TBL-2021]|nr:MAG: hypothetical protein L6R42_001050 [Xanthoria sp. 1 TBL-2021]
MQRARKAYGDDSSQHKSAQLTESDAGDTLQVIGAGLPRTGTSSLKAALEFLGFDPCHHMVECFNKPEHSVLFTNLINAKTNPNTTPDELNLQTAALKKGLRGYRAAVDAPTCEVYEEMLAIFPNAKVILSVRDSKEQWWKSFNDTVGVQLGFVYPLLVYPVGFLRQQQRVVWAVEKHWAALTGGEIGTKVYTAHNQMVHETVPKEQLLEFNVKEGWPRLCEFLEVPVPDVPFPNLNDAKTIKKNLFGAKVMGAGVWSLCLTLAGVSAFLLLWLLAGLKRALAL